MAGTPLESQVHVRRPTDEIWPPKHSSVRMLPKTGFSPTVMREISPGKKFIWPPVKSDQANDIDYNLITSSSGNVGQAWNPESRNPEIRPPAFAPQAPPSRRSTDTIWPPPNSSQKVISRPCPHPVKRVGRFENFVKYRSSCGVPVTYRPPPGTQHVQFVDADQIYISNMVTNTQTTMTIPAKTVRQQQIVEEIEEEEDEEEEDEGEEESEEEEESG